MTDTLSVNPATLVSASNNSEAAESNVPMTDASLADVGPVPMSFPAILRNPGVAKFVQRQTGESVPGAPAPSKKGRRDERGGKRWIRRDENDRFVGNPHIVRATRKDYLIPVPSVRPTFPEPLPGYLSRNAKVAPAAAPTLEPVSANAGRFSLSLKGMRRELRGHGPRTQELVHDIENEIGTWLSDTAVFRSPDTVAEFSSPGRPIGQMEAIREVSRTPLQLVWAIEEDAFARYVVHCCARYHEIVSFSKDTSGQRLTYLLRPNVTRPDLRVTNMLDTPPITDLSSHEVDTESDFVSDARSDFAGTDADRLSVIESDDGGGSRASSPAPSANALDDEWSVIGEDVDADGDESANEGALVESVQSLTLGEGVDSTPRAVLALRQRSLRASGWDGRQGRSGSSPSRSPARRVAARRKHAAASARAEMARARGQRSFYDYLFS